MGADQKGLIGKLCIWMVIMLHILIGLRLNTFQKNFKNSHKIQECRIQDICRIMCSIMCGCVCTEFIDFMIKEKS